jgi:hypothetical protein
MGVSFCEISGTAYTQITSEVVHHDHVQDLATLQGFLDRKVALFNLTMVRLHLPYRFERYWNTDPNRCQEVKVVMESHLPPSPGWWRENYLLLAKYPYDMAYVSKDSLFVLHWQIIQSAFHLAQAIINRPTPREYSAQVETLFSRVYAATHVTLSTEHGSRLLEEISEMRQRLHSENVKAGEGARSGYYVRRMSDLRRVVYAVLEWSKIRTLERETAVAAM